MRHFLIGDVQGCRAALEDLLVRIAFDPATDHVFFAGDLVARGPDSLGTLRLIKNLGSAASTVLGNHDLHLLAAFHGHARVKPKDLTQPILDAFDAPSWSFEQAQTLAFEVETILRSEHAAGFFAALYGNEPSAWSDDLAGTDRLRVITNHFTRMRLIDADGQLNFQHKTGNSDLPEGFKAWFDWPALRPVAQRVFFGHWAALDSITHQTHAIALDSGCVWGKYLTAYCLETGERTTSTPGLT